MKASRRHRPMRVLFWSASRRRHPTFPCRIRAPHQHLTSIHPLSIVNDESPSSSDSDSPVPPLPTAPCDNVDASTDLCAPREVSFFHLFGGSQGSAAGFIEKNTSSVEEILEKGLRLAGASPVHLVIRGAAVVNSARCDWRGIARTAGQREDAIRFWLGLDADDEIPDAAYLEALFTITPDTVDPVFRETAKSNLDAIARGGLSEEYLFLTCYADYTVSEYILGTGPMGVTPLSVAYDRMDEAHSYELYQKEHTAGEFGPSTSTPLMSEGEYEAFLAKIVEASETALQKVLEGHQAVVFLAPMGAHNAIAVEAWQAVAQWDVQRAEDGTLYAVRYGAHEGDPEHTQTLANLKSRITVATTATSTTATSTAATTTATSTAATTTRIATVSGLNQYYHNIGVADGMDGGYSDTIRIIDNPLLLDGGQAYALSSDEALLKWTTDTSATNYESRYRRLGYCTAFGIGSKDHTNLNWPKGAAWPYYHGTETEAPDTPGNQTIDDLDEGEIYAFQINYEIGDTKVFSARDAYVWPSSTQPAAEQRVATYPFFGHHPSSLPDVAGEFEYIICDSDFPPALLTDWRKLVRHAFGQWQEATGGFIQMTPRIDGTSGYQCSDSLGKISEFIMDDDLKNEVRMLDVSGNKIDILSAAFPELKSDVFKICLAEGVACVTSFTGYSGLETNCDVSGDVCETTYMSTQTVHPGSAPGLVSVPLPATIDRTLIADLLRKQLDGSISALETITLLEIIQTAAYNTQAARNPLTGVDVTFKHDSFILRGPSIPGDGDEVNEPGEVQFNTCRDSGGNPDPDDSGYFAYKTAVHEAGHALGLSNFDYGDLVLHDAQYYDAAHPTIPDSVMNYDNEEDIRHPVGHGFSEPDCSPHPFDVMAIYALYQSAPSP